METERKDEKEEENREKRNGREKNRAGCGLGVHRKITWINSWKRSKIGERHEKFSSLGKGNKKHIGWGKEEGEGA